MMDLSRLPAVFALLLIGGFVYDAYVVDKIERRNPPLGVTAFEVVGGVLFTMVGFGMLAGFDMMLLALICFAPSGIPMILGSLRRAGVFA